MADDFTPDPSQKGNGLMGIDPELVMHMGLGLMSAAKYGGNIGDSLQQAYQGYQVGKLRKQQIQMGAVDQALMIGALQRRGLIPPGGGPQGPNVPGSMPVMPGQGAQSPFFASNQPMVPPQQSAPNPYAPVTQQDINSVDVPNMFPPDIEQPLALGQHRDPNSGIAAYMGEQRNIIGQQRAAGLARLDSYLKSDHPEQYAVRDQDFMKMWPDVARQLSLNPNDYSPQNVRRGIGFIRNQLAGSIGKPEEAVPEQVLSGTYGSQYDPVSLKQLTEPKTPVKVGDRYNSDTQQTEAVFANMAPQAPGAPLAGATTPRAPGTAPPAVKGTGAAGRGGGGQIVQPIGFDKPSAENNKAAMFAQEFRGGAKTLNQFEARKYQMSPTARAIAISMATDESGSPINQVFQQQLAAHALSKDDQAYLAALMPVLQAAGHDQSGARLTTAQIRQNVESLLPMGKDNKVNMDQVHENRQGFYTGLLTQAGPAVLRMGPYKELLQDWNQISAAGGKPLPLFGWGKGAHPQEIMDLLKKYPRVAGSQ